MTEHSHTLAVLQLLLKCTTPSDTMFRSVAAVITNCYPELSDLRLKDGMLIFMWLPSHRPGGVSMLPDSSVCFE